MRLFKGTPVHDCTEAARGIGDLVKFKIFEAEATSGIDREGADEAVMIAVALQLAKIAALIAAGRVKQLFTSLLTAEYFGRSLPSGHLRPCGCRSSATNAKHPKERKDSKQQRSEQIVDKRYRITRVISYPRALVKPRRIAPRRLCHLAHA